MSTMPKQLPKELTALFKQAGDKGLDEVDRKATEITHPPTRSLLSQVGLDASTTQPFELLDGACGSGPTIRLLHDTISPEVLSASKITCGDLVESLIQGLAEKIEQQGWANTEAKVMDAQDSGLPDKSLSHVTIGFGMHIIPDPEAVIQDSKRILKPGGSFGFTTWLESEKAWIPDFRSTFQTLPSEVTFPDPLPMQMNKQGVWGDPEWIRHHLEGHGFVNVRVNTPDHVVHVESPEDFMDRFGMILDWVTMAFWTEEQREKYGSTIKERMIEHLREKHGGEEWDTIWTSIVASGENPA